VKGIKFTGYAAGHVLGAAMFEIDIEGVKILYTGDYSMEVLVLNNAFTALQVTLL
jgi:cleavage and polyadenylation specificity factor subunit 3